MIVTPHHSVIVQAIELIESRIGIAVGKQFQAEFSDLFSRLAQGSPTKYLNRLRETDEQAPEWQRLINTLTIGETYFLREQNHFELLKRQILPKLILRRRQTGNHSLRIWSAGCASGEEPYSIATVLHQFLPDLSKWQIDIYGTDINEFALQSARNGVYRQWAFRHTDALFKQQYFDEVNGGIQIKPFIRNMVTFRRHNLLNDIRLGSFDIVFCRNVLLYFEEENVVQAESRLFDALGDGGWLFLGQAEALRHQRDRWLMHTFPATPIYQRPEDKPSTLPDYRALNPLNQPANNAPNGSKTEDYYKKAVLAVQEDDYQSAEHFLSLALSHQQQLPQTYTLLAWIFANRKAIPEATAYTTAALAVDSLHADAHYVNALLALETNELDDSIRCLQMTLYCNRHHALAAFMLGNLYAQSGNLIKANSQWQQVRRIIESVQPSDYVSALSDVTAGRLDALISELLGDK